MTIKTTRRAALMLALLSPVANADSGWFLGASIGSAELSEDFDGFQLDTDATAYLVSGGWSFNDYVALEAGYRKFGDFEQTLTINGNPARVSISANGFTFGVLGNLPLGERFGLVGKLGSFFWNGNSRVDALSVASPGDTNLYAGAGVDFDLNNRVSFAVDGTWYDLEDASSTIYSLGMRVNF